MTVWTPGETHPNSKNLVKGKIPGSWVSIDQNTVKLTPNEIRTKLEPIILDWGGSELVRRFVYNIYGLKNN